MTSGSALLAFVAGALSSLSPCVLPLLPLVFGAAVTQHRYGAVALALGLALSFTAAGLFIATIGFNLGLDADVFRVVSAVMLIAIGLVLIVPQLETRSAMALSVLSNWGNTRTQQIEGRGLSGQFGLGLLLGLVWSPCVGPTLGAASVAAARGENLGAVALTMLAFGVGAAIPLLLIGLLSRDILLRWRGRLAMGARRGKIILGVCVLVAGVAVLSGLDKRLEASLVAVMPDWLTNLTVRY